MSLTTPLLTTMQLQWVLADAWMTTIVEEPIRSQVNMAATRDLILAACEGHAPAYGVYRHHFELLYLHLTERRPGLVHELGVDWRRTIPLGTAEHGRQLNDAYATVYGARLLISSSGAECWQFARVAYYVIPVGLDPALFHTECPWPQPLLELLHALSRTLGSFSARELRRQPLASELRTLLRSRYYHWRDTQRCIRKDQVSGADEQDHHSCDPQQQEADHHGDDGREVGGRGFEQYAYLPAWQQAHRSRDV